MQSKTLLLVALIGELGAGKTCFVQGLAAAARAGLQHRIPGAGVHQVPHKLGALILDLQRPLAVHLGPPEVGRTPEVKSIFDAGKIISLNHTDGIHLNAADHLVLGTSLAAFIDNI